MGGGTRIGSALRGSRRALLPSLALSLVSSMGPAAQADDRAGAPRVVHVTAASHLSGERTLQHALDALAGEGGVVALGEGRFAVDGASTPEGVPIAIRGAGAEATTITGGVGLVLAPGPRVQIAQLGFEDLERGAVLEEGRYGHIAFSEVRFVDIRDDAIAGAVPGPIERVTVTRCYFERVDTGAYFRNQTSRRMRIADNVFHRVIARPIVVGAKRGDNRYAEITGNSIRGVGPGRHPIGILSYVDHAVIADNTIEDIHADGRHEAISSRGRYTVIRGNRVIDAGGDTGAISLATGGPTRVEGNTIRFSDEHQGLREAIDSRQTRVKIVDNRIIGSSVGVYLRRGGMSKVAGNVIGPSRHQAEGVVVAIRTGAVIPRAAMREIAIEGNTFTGIHRDRGELRGVSFYIEHHAGEHEPRMDDVVIRHNTFEDLEVAGGAVGVYFSSGSRPGSSMRGVRIEGNDVAALDQRIRYEKN